MKPRDLIGRGLLSLAIVLTPGFQVTADWSSGHITNPAWPPHAKYHLLVYHFTLILFSAAAVYGLWGSLRAQQVSLRFAIFALVAFWVPYYVAGLFPQASYYATPELAEHVVPVQLVVGAVLMVIGLLGWLIAASAGRGDAAVVR
jgi:hypothetical protein